MNIENHMQEEKIFLLEHIPNTISNNCDDNFINNLPTGFLTELYGSHNDIKLNIDIYPFDIESLFSKNENKYNDNYLKIDDFIDQNELDNIEIHRLISSFGRDAFGIYLPFHYYDKCWGIYLFKEIIETRVDFLYSIFKSKISLKELKQFYYYAVYRHELFHYQVERFATKIELITKNSIYKPSRTLFQQVRNTENWLEEALAESSVLYSKLVPKRTGIQSNLLKEIYERDLLDMPPGYKDYHCHKYGGPIEAHKMLASQIIENKLSPKAQIPQILSIKNEFISIDTKVPAYLVTGFKNLKRLNL